MELQTRSKGKAASPKYRRWEQICSNLRLLSQMPILPHVVSLIVCFAYCYQATCTPASRLIHKTYYMHAEHRQYCAQVIELSAVAWASHEKSMANTPECSIGSMQIKDRVPKTSCIPPPWICVHTPESVEHSLLIHCSRDLVPAWRIWWLPMTPAAVSPRRCNPSRHRETCSNWAASCLLLKAKLNSKIPGKVESLSLLGTKAD